MPRHKKTKAQDSEVKDQCCQRPWTDYRAQQLLQQQHHTDQQNRAARAACSRLVAGDYVSWNDLLGSR